MMSRGFDGRLPTAEVLRFRVADAALMALVAMTAVAVVLY
jgi:hypothetical protein